MINVYQSTCYNILGIDLFPAQANLHLFFVHPCKPKRRESEYDLIIRKLQDQKGSYCFQTGIRALKKLYSSKPLSASSSNPVTSNQLSFVERGAVLESATAKSRLGSLPVARCNFCTPLCVICKPSSAVNKDADKGCVNTSATRRPSCHRLWAPSKMKESAVGTLQR